MKTEKLNEYIFADLLYQHAQKAWKNRVRKLEEAGNEDARKTTTLTEDDLRVAISSLDWYRLEGLKLLAEAQTVTL